MSAVPANVDQVSTGQQMEMQLLSAERLAALLDISVRTLWRLRSAGKLPPPVRLGGSIRWNAAEIRAWIEAGCPAGTQRQQMKR